MLSTPTPQGNLLASVEPEASTHIVATVYKQDGSVAPNIDVTLQAEVLANSGGHNHDDEARHTIHMGVLSSPQGVSAQNGKVLAGNTGLEGLRFMFKAPRISGDHTISASCTGCTQDGPMEVWVGVRGLMALGNGPWVLIGRKPDHPDNHYMAPLGSQRLAPLAALYRGRFPNDPVLHLNDASLERGGLFDFNARFGSPWVPPHQKHRDGMAIDIRANSESGAVPSVNFAEFVRIARKVGGSAGIHSPGTSNQHFHVTF